MVKKFKMSNSENRSLHKTIDGTNTKKEVLTKNVKMQGVCDKCNNRPIVVAKIMYNRGVSGMIKSKTTCPKCGTIVDMSGKL